MDSTEFQLVFDHEVEARFKKNFQGQTVERASVPGMIRNIVIGFLYELDHSGKLPGAPAKNSMESLPYYRSLAAYILVSVTDSGHVRFDSRAMCDLLYPPDGIPKQFVPPPYMSGSEAEKHFQGSTPTLTGLKPDPNKSFSDNVAAMAKMLADQMALDAQKPGPYAFQTVPPPPPPRPKEASSPVEERKLEFGRKINLDDE